ncbi:hypothetical protein SAMN05443245_5787 [Paraburkholderia fungorum]|uniref:Lipoprotein n=1 Tax=Paraburkholderia fungorum TaxID=134537 RepID=A0A1H1IWD3_9BURK|nr:hypothetical protein [Paraburkholderia fungorum]SDR42012.1 hypothetical protein SAMN05443245_5787 [Paraburkholderia fungorum]
MKRDKHLGRTARVAMATIASSIALSAALSGCGADDSAPPTTSSATSSSSSQGKVANDAAQQSMPASIAAFAPSASAPSAPFAADPAASDPVAETMQANLAADNQQIAPVMRYAPGDGRSSN